MVERAAGDRQPEALDRVGEQDRRPCRVCVWPPPAPARCPRGRARRGPGRASRPHRRTTRRAGPAARDPARPGRRATPRRRRPRRRRRGSGSGRSASRRSAAGGQVAILLRKLVAQAPPVYLQLQHLPARRLEQLLELRRPDHGHDPVEALAVQVDDPEHVAEAACLPLEHRLPEAALVDLASPSSEMNGPAGAPPEVGLDVAVAQRAEQRRGRAEPNRPRSSSRPGTDPSVAAPGTPGARRAPAASSGNAEAAVRAGTRSRAAPVTREA